MKLIIYNFHKDDAREIRDTITIEDGKLKFGNHFGESCIIRETMAAKGSLGREPTPEEVLRSAANHMKNAELIEGE